MDDTPFVILHIPHASKIIPDEHREQFVLSDRALEREKRLLTDAFTDEIFEICDEMVTAVSFPVSRLLVDPERMQEDREEPMSAAGMGAVYTCCTDGRKLRRKLNPVEREKLLLQYYTPHHRNVGEAVERALECHDQALIIDCHSFPSSPLPCDADQSSLRPDICIGTDHFHTPKWLLNGLIEHIERQKLSYEINRPYKGTFVPEPYFGKNSQVSSIMLEVNRRLYMDENNGRKKRGFHRIAGKIRELVRDMIPTEDYFYEQLQCEGIVIAYQDWDSGGPGAGAGRVSVCEYEGAFYTLHDAGYSGPYKDKSQAIKESGITWNNEATREIVFLDDEEVFFFE